MFKNPHFVQKCTVVCKRIRGKFHSLQIVEVKRSKYNHYSKLILKKKLMQFLFNNLKKKENETVVVVLQ